jgi:hypothetical protein
VCWHHPSPNLRSLHLRYVPRGTRHCARCLVTPLQRGRSYKL